MKKNENDYPIYCISYYKNGNIESSKKFYESRLGVLMEETYYYEDGSMHWLKKYYESGREKEIMVFDESGKMRTHRFFDENGNIIPG